MGSDGGCQPCAGVTRQTAPVLPASVRTSWPKARRAPAISWVSRASRGECRVLGPLARAAKASQRLVQDLEPGTRTVACSGPVAVGAGYAAGREVPPVWSSRPVGLLLM